MKGDHTFNPKTAERYGVEAAIIIRNIQFWIMKNRANKKHLHDGRTWTYNSLPAWAEILPYLKERTIRTTLDALVADGVILRGNWSENKWDKTAWYAFSDEAEWLEKPAPIDLSESSDRSVNPDTSSLVNTDNKPEKSESPFSRFLSAPSHPSSFSMEVWQWEKAIAFVCEETQLQMDEARARLFEFFSHLDENKRLAGQQARGQIFTHFQNWLRQQRPMNNKQIEEKRLEWMQTVNMAKTKM